MSRKFLGVKLPKLLVPKKLSEHRFGVAAIRFSRKAKLWIRKKWASLLVGLLVGAIAIAAFFVPGLKTADVYLHDSFVYAVNQNSLLVGSLNTSIDELANASRVGSQDLVVHQVEDTVIVHSPGSGQLQQYNPARNQMSSPAILPPGARVSMGGKNVVVSNPDNGKVYVTLAEQILETDYQTAQAQLDVGQNGWAIATPTGGALGINISTSTLVKYEDGIVSTIDLPFQVDPQAANLELSYYGNKAVVLDRNLQRIWVEGNKSVLDVSGASNARLASPAKSISGEKYQAIYATNVGLITVTKDGTFSLTGELHGTPITPVVVGECVYGAFGKQVAVSCHNKDVRIQDIPQLPSGAKLVFQTNRGTVILQDVVSGMIWLVNEDMKIVNNWDQIKPSDVQQENEVFDDDVILPERREENRPPVANDDLNLAARAGRTTVLPVLDNDSDPDGDVLTISTEDIIDDARLAVTGGGTGVQITLPETPSGKPYQFSYQISDGRGGIATAQVNVQPLPANQAETNRAPLHFRSEMVMKVAANGKATKRVLLDWRDPDGDQMVLLGAETDNPSDEVTFTPDGELTYNDVGKSIGKKKVRLTVSDGVVSTVSDLQVEVSEDPVVAPLAYADYVTTKMDTDVVVSPLKNDVGMFLRLSQVSESTPDFTVKPNFSEGTFTFRSAKEGTHYVLYQVNNGMVATGLVRIDVTGPASANRAPVAAPDLALVPGETDGSVLLDPLANDFDPDSDVLVLQSVSADPRLKIVMHDRRLLSISAVRNQAEPVALTYYVSDGINRVESTITVLTAPVTGDRRPQANNDEVNVRTGSTATVPVLQNDFSPVGFELKIDKIVSGTDRAWIDGENIRVQIPEGTPGGAFGITYQVRDAIGVTDSATIDVTVISSDDQNFAPIPKDIEARVISGTIQRIPIPLTNIDPNGDPVRVLGLGSGPRLGRIRAVGDGWLEYESYPRSQGTDSFTYQVTDSLGAVGVGQIRVGIALPANTAVPPVTVPDLWTVRPRRELSLPVVENDYDPNGNELSLDVNRQPKIRGAQAVVAEESPSEIRLKAPEEPGTYSGTYTLITSKKMTADGTFTVVVDPNAQPIAPVAVDDQVQVLDILDKQRVDVPVLANDFDIDGPKTELKLSVVGCSQLSDCATVNPDGTSLSVPVGQHMRQFRYRITDRDQETADGLVNMPGKADSVPVLKDPNLHLEVTSGKSLTIDINSFVTGSQAGRQVRLTSVEQIFHTGGETSRTNDTTLTFKAAAGYFGPGSVIFGVEDDIRDETERKNAVISIPIEIKKSDASKSGDNPDETAVNEPPEGPELTSFTVGAGEPEQEFHLDGLYQDPEGSSVSFGDWKTASDGSAGLISYRFGAGESTVYASAAIDTPKGVSLIIEGRAYDANGGSKPIRVEIVGGSSTKPLTTTVEDRIDDANAGQPVSIMVLANDTSHLDNPALELISANITSGNGEVKVEGDKVVVTPAKDFPGYPGYVIGSYLVGDATKDPDRQVSGTFRVFVRRAPDTPGVPKVESVGDHSARITWTSNNNGGTEVTGYEVSARSETGQNLSQQCETNTCSFDGLQNAVLWYFKVRETNAAGTSEWSEESAGAMPDKLPGPPGTPTEVEHTDKSIVLAWTPSDTSDQTAVNKYEIIRSDSEKAVIEGESAIENICKSGSCKFTWTTSVDLGTEYYFHVVAYNQASTKQMPPKGVESGKSDPMKASRKPGRPEILSAINTEYEGRDAGDSFIIRFNPPQDQGGDLVDKYYLLVKDSTNGSEVYRQEGIRADNNQITVAGKTRKNKQYDFELAAGNRDGYGEFDVMSSVHSIGAPETPTSAQVRAGSAQLVISNVSVSDHNNVAFLRVEAKPVQGHGETRIQDFSGISGGTISGLTNGESYVVKIQACQVDSKQAADKQNRCSSPYSVPNQVMPVSSQPPSIKIDTSQFKAVDGKGNRVEVVAIDSNEMFNHGGIEPAKIKLFYQVDDAPVKEFASMKNLTDKAKVPFTVDVDTRNSKIKVWSEYRGVKSKIETVFLPKPVAAEITSAGVVSFYAHVAALRNASVTSLTCRVDSSSPSSSSSPVTLNMSEANTSADGYVSANVNLPEQSTPYTAARITCKASDSGKSFYHRLEIRP